VGKDDCWPVGAPPGILAAFLEKPEPKKEKLRGLPWPRRLWKAALLAVEALREPVDECRREANGHLSPEPRIEIDYASPDRPRYALPVRTEGDVNMSDRQLAFIEKCAQLAPIHRYLEIGVYYGTTTCILAQLGSVDAVDWFRGNSEAGLWIPTDREHTKRVDGFLSNLDRMRVRNMVTVLEGPSQEVVPHLRYERFGLALIDGDHSFKGCLSDLRNTWDLVVPGGFVLLDDYSEVIVQDGVQDDVSRAWRAFAAERNLNGGLTFTTPDPTDRPKLVAIRKST
jgi:predicted O-methyltransferase YrrM